MYTLVVYLLVNLLNHGSGITLTWRRHDGGMEEVFICDGEDSILHCFLVVFKLV